MTTNHAPTISPARRKRSANPWRPFVVVFGIALAAIFATIIFVACSGDQQTTQSTPTATPVPVSTDGIIPEGVTVNGVGVGGMNQDDARIALANGLPDISTGKLTINIGALTADVTYASVGRAYDLDATIQAAFASAGGAVDAVTTYNADSLAQQVNDFVATAQAAPVNATIGYENGEYVLTSAVDGQSVDGAAVLASAGALMANGHPEDQVLDAQVTTVPADINSEAAQAAIDHALAVTNSPLTITAGSQSFVVDSATLRNWVQLEQTTPGVWTLTVDEPTVTAYVNTIKTQVDQPAVDAEWHFGDAAEPVVIPSQTGYEVDAATAVSQIEAALAAATGPVAPITLAVVATEPDFTTAEAQAQAGNVELLGEWTTHYIPSHFNGDGINIRRPASLIDGTVIQPGDVFDFYRHTAPYTIANGYGEGAALLHGHIKADGVLGGGLCSASTTMFNAALRAGFQMGARYNHAYYISRYPVGLDATIWVSGASVKNMTFTNDSRYPIVIKSINKKRSVTFQVWGVSDGRKVTIADPVVTNEVTAAAFYEFTNALAPRVTAPTDDYLVDGFDAVVGRTVRDAAGQVIHQDTFRSHYTKVDVIVLLGRCNNDPLAPTRIPYTDVPPPCNGATPTPGPTGTPGPETSPTASFNRHNDGGGTYSFNASASTGGGLTYAWDFGDGSTGSGQQVSHTFAPGLATVTLTVTNSVGSHSATKTFTATGGATPSPSAPPPPPTDPPPPPTDPPPPPSDPTPSP